jgi:RNA polymerase sigma-70 factor (ECF subfamily)
MFQKTLDKQTDTGAHRDAHTDNPFGHLLLDVAQNRNKDSFVQLFEHFAPRVKSFLMKGGTPEDVADELAQETMLAVWNKAEAYNPARASASTWIFTIARNKKIDTLRKVGRFEAAPTDPELLQAEDTANANVMATQETEMIAEALEALPSEQAMLLHKSFFEDKSHADIAKETGLALGTVKSRIRLALESLRKNKTVRELR